MDDETKTEQAALTADDLPIPFAEFLESVPPSTFRNVYSVREIHSRPNGTTFGQIAIPELQLHCSSDVCDGTRFFRYETGEQGIGRGVDNVFRFITFLCDNCRKQRKIFALSIHVPRDENDGKVYKYGEYPSFGVPTPTRLLRLFGNESSLFLKGRRCENQGLGIGVFTYYRRVVESHKDQIFDQVIKVAAKAAPQLVQRLEEAKKQIQFSSAVEAMKDALPQTLLVDGHNPLTLLHSALSKGLHAKTDEECLELARDVRIVLADMIDRIGRALKDDAELRTAVSRLTHS